MQKNYMPEIAQLLGIEIGEEFNILTKYGDIISYNPYKFTDKTIVDRCNDEINSAAFFLLLTGGYMIQKRPWRPRDYEEYWTVLTNGEIGYAYFDYNSARDLATLNMGNCFPTKEIAEKAKPEILAKFDKISKGTLE